MNFQEINQHMDQALQEAKTAFHKDEVPVGCVIVSEHGEILAEAHNEKEEKNDPCGHAEIYAIQRACEKIGSWRLLNSSVYVTLEPCVMCMAALLNARVSRLYFGAYDKKGGALSLGYNLNTDKNLNHNFLAYGGFRHFECSRLISTFFQAKRQNYKQYK